MRVIVDSARCQGHTLCVLNSPAVFASSEEDGHALVLLPDVPDSEVDAVRLAAESCPENAITIEE